DALRDALAAKEIEPDHALALQVIGMELYTQKKHNDEAITVLEQVQKVIQQGGERWKMLADGELAAKRLQYLADLYLTKRSYKEAAAYYSEIIDMKGAPPKLVGRVSVNVGLFYEVGVGVDRNYGRAAEYYRKAA